MSGFDLGAPIGSRNTVPSQGFDQGEHGAGTGLAGGHGVPNASNTQAGQYAQEERSGFNAGVGGSHASGGIPSGTPIADKFTSGSGNTPEPYGSTGAGTGTVPTSHHGHHHGHHEGAGVGSGTGTGAKLDNALDQYSSTGSRVGGVGSGDAVSGAYEGGGARDGLTGQSDAHTTGSGVSVGGENLHGDHHARDAALAGTAAGAGALAGTEAYSHSGSHGSHGASATSSAPLDRGEGVAGIGGGLQPGVGGETGSGVGPSGGAGGHYNTGSASGTGTGTGTGTGHGSSSSGLGAGAGAGALGAGGVGAGAAGSSGRSSDGPSDPTSGSGGAGKYGRAEAHDGQGKPLSDPKDIDTGGPHSLVYQESTGQYVHRRELEGAGAAAKEARSTH
ncbi:hypothetical protein I316_00796 [Kwoniella heveanensis BCC8398]|uniref:Uncharacterized protein n=1 Tax=Kwoniella heveanensis BCC8398 TaxID=1296120 RepID=A0A1B9H331_9TREE|nr:hypothetical protein I316_00796 [Kwoniella heveanensis BCC8398]